MQLISFSETDKDRVLGGMQNAKVTFVLQVKNTFCLYDVWTPVDVIPWAVKMNGLVNRIGTSLVE